MSTSKGLFRWLAQLLVRWEPLFLALLAFPLMFPTPGRILALAGLPLLWISRRVVKGHFVDRTPLDGAILLLLGMVLVSLGVTFDLLFSLPKVCGVLLGVAVFYATVHAIQDERHLAWGLGIFVTVGVGLAVLSLLGTRWVFKMRWASPWLPHLPTLLKGLPGAEKGFHPHEVAGALLWFIPLNLALLPALFRHSPHSPLVKGGLLGATALTLVTFALTQSRSGLMGLVVGLLAMLACTGWRGRLFALGLVVVSLLVPGVRGLLCQFPEALSQGGSISSEAVGVMRLAGRVEMWSRALYIIADFPFTGIGMNAFRRVVHVLYPLFLISPDKDIAHAHNELLQAALDLGIPGLVAFLATYLVAWFLVLQIRVSCQVPWMRAAALGFGASLLAHFVYGLTDAVALGAKPGVAWWMELGLLVALFNVSRRRDFTGQPACTNPEQGDD